MNPESLYRTAREDFRHARRQAMLKDIIGRVRGDPIDLLPFTEVLERINAKGEECRGLQEIPIDAIVGSVGRYTDFTRDFLPRTDSAASRWVRIKTAFRNLGEMPPIDVYQIGGTYFVLDGNHRVSVARERGAKTISAYVTEIFTQVPLTPDINLEDLILKAEHTNFLEKTHLSETTPQSDLAITVPGRFHFLEAQIEQYRAHIEQHNHQKISFPDAAQRWYAENYLPVIKAIRARGILRDFPNRTETDLYVWINQHQDTLRENLGWHLEPSVVATDLADQFGARPNRIIARLRDKIRSTAILSSLSTGPAPGKFRQRQQEVHAHDPTHLFTHMLLPLSGTEESWRALELGLRLAWREEAHLMGLHIVPVETDIHTPQTENIRARFDAACKNKGLPGELAIEVGPIVPIIVKRARLSDLVIIHLAHPPENHPLTRLESGIRKLIHRCPRPILTVPKTPKKLDRLLVAYNGNPQSTEALYAAAYFSSRWDIPLFVLTVLETNKVNLRMINQARYYLRSRQIPATFIQKRGAIAETILQVSVDHQIDLIVMGGYSRNPVMEMVLGSPLDQVLFASRIPVLICR
jgi:nucleotide-binding universal stress UspA family protein/uncharacterized ParB-like nuclease family protein